MEKEKEEEDRSECSASCLECSSSLITSPRLTVWSALSLSKHKSTKPSVIVTGRIVKWWLVGLLTGLCGAASLVWTPYDLLISERLMMRKGMPAYEWWAEPPDNVILSVYLFNITNSQRFTSGQDLKLKVEEIGPIIYREKLSHSNIVQHDNGTMSYTSSRSVQYLPELNTIPLNSIIVVPNLPILGMSSYMWNAPFSVKLGFSLLVSRLGSKPLVSVTIQDYLWNLTDPVSSAARSFLPYLVPKDNFGVLQQIYEDYTDRLSVLVGKENGLSKFFHVDSFNGRPGMGAWKNSTCDSLQGSSEGAGYHMDMKRSDVVSYLRKAFCRRASLSYTGDDRISGMTVFKYELSNDSFSRPQDGNDCFLQDGLPTLPSGLTDASPCYHNFPIATSFPHFLVSDPAVTERLEGLRPDYAKHHSYVYVEPKTGVPLTAAARIQSNLVMRPVKSGFSKLRPFFNMTIPMFWAEYKMASLPWKITALTYFTVVIVDSCQTYFSVLLLFVALFCFYRASRLTTKSREDPPEPAQDSLLEAKTVARISGS